MKTVRNTLCAVSALILILSFAFMANVQKVNAAGPPLVYNGKKTLTVIKYAGDKLGYNFRVGDKSQGGSSLNLTVQNSNKDAIIVDLDTYKQNNKVYFNVNLRPKKNGKATLLFKITKNGKTKTYRQKLIVMAYKNPLKTAKLNGKNVTAKLKKTSATVLKCKPGKAYANVAAANGWKVISRRYFAYPGGKYVNKKYTDGKKIAIAKNSSVGFVYTLKNIKTGAEEKITLNAEAR